MFSSDLTIVKSMALVLLEQVHSSLCFSMSSHQLWPQLETTSCVSRDISLFCAVLQEVGSVLGSQKGVRFSTASLDTTFGIVDRCPISFEVPYEVRRAKKIVFVLLRKRAFLLWWYSSPIGRQLNPPPAP
jgi:hypothetical protein